jgi:hypothetical protein
MATRLELYAPIMTDWSAALSTIRVACVAHVGRLF